MQSLEAVVMINGRLLSDDEVAAIRLALLLVTSDTRAQGATLANMRRVSVMLGRLGRYILNDDHTPVPCEDLKEWAMWMEHSDRHVGLTDLGDVEISTVFLGLDHNWSDAGPPLVFETMVFRDGDGDDMWRCATWDEAVKQHEAAVALVRRECTDDGDA